MPAFPRKTFEQWWDDYRALATVHAGAWIIGDMASYRSFYDDRMTPAQALAEELYAAAESHAS